jgi:spermidine synthase
VGETVQLDESEWIIRRRGEDEIHALRRHPSLVASEKTKFQLVEIVDTIQFGKALLLDGVYQSSEYDQLLKHEALVHPVMSLKRNAAVDVLVIGGGEGCVAREVLRHPNVSSLVMMELDERVTALCAEYLGWEGGTLSNPKLSLMFGNAAALLPSLPAEKKFDVVIVDSTQPTHGSLAGPLVEISFLQELKRRLRPRGFLAGYGINAAPIVKPLRSEIRRRSAEVLGGSLIEYVVPCPFYSASFAFQLCTCDIIDDLGSEVLRSFADVSLDGERALDVQSMLSYLSIPWGYRAK